MSEDINFGAITEALNDKADRDLNNTQPVADYVVERYDDGAGNWYEVWKSGRLRQGGRTYTTTSVDNGTISLLKAFSDTNYTIQTTAISNRSLACVYDDASKTTTSFNYAFRGDYGASGQIYYGIYWTAEGKGA